MPKFCNNGHQMEDSWEVCPYCQRTGFQNPSGMAANLAKTRLEFEAAPAASAMGGAPAARKTVLLSGRPKGELAGWLVVMTGDQKGEDFRVREGQNSIGSGIESDIVIKDPAVSGKHAALRCRDKKFLLTDLDSSNGTYLNDAPDPISMEELHDNDTIRMGTTLLKVKML
jgi:Inner membrane component of T3SS, cytoplasmic domain